jgi:hypothetical protein
MVFKALVCLALIFIAGAWFGAYLRRRRGL